MSKDSKEEALIYRQAVEAYLGGRKVEAAAIFQRPEGIANDIENLIRLVFGAWEHVTKGRVGRLHGSFLLAVPRRRSTPSSSGESAGPSRSGKKSESSVVTRCGFERTLWGTSIST